MKFSNIITLLTDFGTQDGYVGAMKGRIKELCSEAEILDITHEIQPFDIKSGAFALYNAFRFFPAGTIHVAVVDPGVGTSRTPLLVHIADQFIICPDNGLLSLVTSKYENFEIYEITTNWVKWEISDTFHGRDLFAPAAALLLKNKRIDAVAVPYKNKIHTFMVPVRLVDSNHLVLRVLHIDRFGNIITNLNRDHWESLKSEKQPRLRIKKGFIYGINKTFDDVVRGQLLMLWDSSGYLQIAQNQGNAAQTLGIQENDEMILEI